MREVIGWGSAFILLPTFGLQVYKQWQARHEPAPASALWFFILALVGVAGQVAYSWMLGNWVYFVLNACLVVTNTAGLALAVHRRGLSGSHHGPVAAHDDGAHHSSQGASHAFPPERVAGTTAGPAHFGPKPARSRITSTMRGDLVVMPVDLGFPTWVRLSHWFNVLFVTMLVRSGLEILSAHPKLYWNNACMPGSEWLRFTRKRMPKDQLWTSRDEEVGFSPWIALPGGEDRLGLGRYWHFTAVLGWTLAGLLYFVLLFATDQWRRLVPTSWSIVPDAWHALVAYLSFRLPGEGTTENPLAPYNALQQIAYVALVFGLTPHMILTGLAMSPAVESRARWYPRLFFGRQPARSLHFLGMAAYLAFIGVHLLMVVVHGPARELTKIVLGEGREGQRWLGLGLGLAIITCVVLIHAAATVASRRAPRSVHRVLSALVDPPRRALLHQLTPVTNYSEAKISPYFRVNGYPPTEDYPEVRDDEYIRLKQGDFADWRLEVSGLVASRLQLSLEDLRAMPRQEQTTMHHCIQGWTAIGRWAGVCLSDVLDRCQVSPEARYLVFRSYQRHQESGKPYYEVIDLETARQPQTIVAYEMNGVPLPIAHGAPLRLRVENELGFKMVKYLRGIEAVAEYRTVGGGMGGIREDVQQFDMSAHI